MWKRSDVSGCNCNEKKYRHVHCPCAICNGRATDRKTEIRHWKEANRSALKSSQRHRSTTNSRENNCESVDFEFEVSENEVETVGYTARLSNPRTEDLLSKPNAPREALEDGQSLNDFSDNISHDGNSDLFNPLKKLVVDAVLNALKILIDSGMSIKTFEDAHLMNMASSIETF